MGEVLPAKRQRFVDEYLVDLNATQAAIRAGYSPRTAKSQGQRLLTDVDISAAITRGQVARAERTEITQDWVLGRLVDNANRAMQLEPVKDSLGRETGEYQYQGAVANKALELIGKHLGMFKDEVKHTGSVRFELDIPRPEPGARLALLPPGDEDEDD